MKIDFGLTDETKAIVESLFDSSPLGKIHLLMFIQSLSNFYNYAPNMLKALQNDEKELIENLNGTTMAILVDSMLTMLFWNLTQEKQIRQLTQELATVKGKLAKLENPFEKEN